MKDEISLLKSEKRNNIATIDQLNSEVKVLEGVKGTGQHSFHFHFSYTINLIKKF